MNGFRNLWQTRNDAIFTAIANYVDFKKYDNNNNGIIDQSELAINLIVAGYNATLNIPGQPLPSESVRSQKTN